MGPMGPNRPIGWVVPWARAYARETYEGVPTAPFGPRGHNPEPLLHAVSPPTDAAPAARPVRNQRPHPTSDMQVSS